MTKSVLAFSMSSFFLGLFGVSWNGIDKKIDDEYPLISFIESAELEELYRDGAVPIVVDVRTEDEFAVSHLSGAIRIETADAIAEVLTDKDAPIVVYCSVGYRSAGVAAELEKLGYGNVKNLRHSIFAWADQGRPLVSEHGDTDYVHPFNRVWGSLISRPLHAYKP